MHEESMDLAGLPTRVISPSDEAPLLVVLLHGYSMRAEDLAPFARSLGVRARFLVPEGPCPAVPRGRAWWAIDAEARALARAAGPRDLAAEHPAGASAARAGLSDFLRAAQARWGALPLALAGFSQGGMLACDTALRGDHSLAGLALLSSSRISIGQWLPLAERLRGLPVLVSHGRADDDLSFAAGEALRDFVESAGAAVTWVPHDGGHELPPVVWRRLRAFLAALVAATATRRD
jgi:phospholipase/carboxylesterase